MIFKRKIRILPPKGTFSTESGSGSELQRRLNKIRGLPIVHTQSYVCGLPPGHRFQMNKFSGVFECLVKDRIIDPKAQVPS